MRLSILLIEDNLAIARQLTEFLTGLGWAVAHVSRGKAGADSAIRDAGDYDLVLLDLNLPDMDGLEVCRLIKGQAPVVLPVLMLTARDAFTDKAAGFGQGADDYLVKPFDFRELALRCEALTRRERLHSHETMDIGELRLNLREKTASRQRQPLALTRVGFAVLQALAEAYPRALTRSQLIHKVWRSEPPDSDALRSHIYSVRRVLDKPFARPMLKTIVNVGYKLEVYDDDSF
ncbi:response regulator transcription factor [Gilvimarinus algae]|uniref:Response regulator transcription factor n=1 Tax=Gilvimarinus algae TaxID=3058037 RepID=A0ABT8TGH6_9GAMM|nr:response regulator transcription factor [Gilvimarinus sp. SDUM040014]MDO3383195.1 response regulator transcription factor [Gilvimarinus sp. SDUM040014]